MKISDLVKELFAIMGKHGDLEVFGEVEVIHPADPHELHLKSVGVSKEESQELPRLMQEDDSTYL